MAWRTIVFAFSAFVVVCAVLMAAPAFGWFSNAGVARMGLIALANCCACLGVAWTLVGLRARWVRNRWRGTLVLCAAGALILGAIIASWAVRGLDRNWTVSPLYPVATFAGACFSVGLYFLLADLLGFVTRNARSLRVRLIVFGLLCAGVSSLLARVELTSSEAPWGARIISVLVVGIAIWGLARTLSEGLTERLDLTVHALEAVSGGDLQVKLDESGRDELARLATAFNAMTAGLRDRDFLERAFGQYVAPSVLEALKRADGLHLQPERREASVLFADVRGFTAFSERNPPEVVLRTLNTYLERVVEIVGRHQGYLNKFIGDAVMVVFNAPVDQPDHARRALACAREMMAAVEAQNREGAFGEGARLEVGLGVNSGPLVAGTLGGADRAEYTVIGDTVNVASRLCSAAGPGELLVGAATAERSGDASLSAVAPMQVKGKAEPLAVFRAGSEAQKRAAG